MNVINEYDKASRITRRCYTKPNIQTSATACVELTETQLSGNTPYVSYFYDGFMEQSQPPTASPNLAKGKLTRVYSSVSETKYTQFDDLGRLTQSQQITDGTTYTSSYEYNFSGALVKVTYPSGRVVQNQFESDGDLSRIYGKANTNAAERTYANSFSYTADGRIEKLRLGNGLWESAKFNNRLQVTEFNLGIGVNDASKWKLQYQYGELQADGTTVDTNKNTGNIAKQTSSFAGLANPFVQTFKYDSLYRLKEAKETVSTTTTWKQNFDYDRFGNRISFIDEIGGQVQTNTNLRHPSINANTNRFNDNQGYVYDKNGNLTNDPTNSNRTFIFNGENKQTEVKDVNGNPIGKYFYDGEGKRVKKEVYSGGILTEITVFVYSNGKLVAEYSTLPPPSNPTTSYTMTDQLDSPRVLTNALGEVTNRRDFKPFGEEITPETAYRTTARKYGVNDNIRQKFTGYQKDTETQLDFAEARMYQNLHGRFTAVDPLLASGKSANPQTFNRFVYCLNNPLVLTDPSGLQAGSWYYPVDEKGEPRYGEKYKYIENGKSTDGYKLVTERNRAGELIGSGGGIDGYVIRFNPNGPMSDDVQRTMILMNKIATPYEIKGYEVIMSDGLYDFLYESMNGDINAGKGVQNVSLDLVFALQGGLAITRSIGNRAVSTAFRGGSEGATTVLEGGSGKALAGHGVELGFAGETTIPTGTSFTVSRSGVSIKDNVGGLMEQGKWTELAKLAQTQPLVAEQIRGMTTYLPGSTVPNYILRPPTGLTIFRNSTTVTADTPLNQLLRPNMGNCVFAACTTYPIP